MPSRLLGYIPLKRPKFGTLPYRRVMASIGDETPSQSVMDELLIVHEK